MRQIEGTVVAESEHDPKKTCFIAMPITTSDDYAEKLGDLEHFPHVLTHLFVPALEEAGLTAIEPSTVGAELIHAEIIRNLEQADFVLYDLSGLNPNVLFELGVRTSLDRPVILVKDNLTDRIPFDLNAVNTFTYDSSLTPWSLAKEQPRLVSHIRSVTASMNAGNPMWRYFGLTKRATPSEAGENPLEAKIDLLIRELSRSQSPSSLANQKSSPRARRGEGTEIEAVADSYERDVVQRIFGEEGVTRYRLWRDEDNPYKLNVSLNYENAEKISTEQIAYIRDQAVALGLDLVFTVE